jgi:allantoin racemase
MKIMLLGKQPRKSAGYDLDKNARSIQKHLAPDTQVIFDFPEDYDGTKAEKELGKQKKLNGTDHAMVTPGLMRKALWAEENGFDAVVQSNTFDPGIEACRHLVGIPVIGILRTAVHVASTLADRVGIMVPLESHVPYTWRILRSYGVDGLIADIQPLGIYGSDLSERVAEITDTACKLIKGLAKDKGAHFVIPLGGALIPYIVDPADLQKATGVPVMNTTVNAVRFAESCVLQGLSHSPLSYPRGKLKASDLMERA